MVSGWKVENSDSWELIGKQDPQQPQMFYPVGNPELSLTRGDVVAARCTMVNTRDRTTFVGATKEDEMCNFYIMYWVEGDSPMDQTTCFSRVSRAVQLQYRKCLHLAETPLILLLLLSFSQHFKIFLTRAITKTTLCHHITIYVTQ